MLKSPVDVLCYFGDEFDDLFLFLVKKILGIRLNSRIILKNIGWALLYLPVPIVFSCCLEIPFGVRIAVEGALMAGIFALINLKFNKCEMILAELQKLMRKIRPAKNS